MRPVRFPIRLKLTAATLLPLTAAIVTCWFAGVVVITTKIVGQAQEKVRNDLNAAREVCASELGHVRDVVKITAAGPYAAEGFGPGKTRPLAPLLVPLLAAERLDIVTAVDSAGTVILRAANPAISGDNLSSDPLVARALRGESAAGTVIIPPGRLLREGEKLARRAVVESVPTPHGRGEPAKQERSGMLLAAAEPVRDAVGRVVGALYGAVLLNNDNRLVDRIKSIVYDGGKTDDGELGNATIFLGDVAIATNVAREGKRAIGTRLSTDVHQRVLLRGEKWFDRAYVVSDWYFAACEPLRSPEGVPVGALYVGMLEGPTTGIKMRLGLLYSAILLFGTGTGLAVASFIAGRMARPIGELATAVRRFAAGERDLRIEIRSRDEIGLLADEFAAMTTSLAAREEEIRELNADLERKVRERTAELEEKNRLLVKTQEDLVRAGRLADIGLLAAGVAHEINNPMAIIRGNAEILQMDLPEGHPSHEEADTIIEQAGRIERIVGSLLKFARQHQMGVRTFPLHAMLDDILKQVGHQVPLEGIEVRRDYAPSLPRIEGDPDHLRQVFTNLVLNALQAMGGSGELVVATRYDVETGSCQVSVSDTGCGIHPDDARRIFTPFFTTRQDGTGLGLPVSYGIVKDHGGEITVRSVPGEGTIFRVTLPVTQGERERDMSGAAPVEGA